MLEKIGLPPKPSLRGSSWVVDASHCQGCASQFTFINRKHHCRRCGGIFCGSCTQQRMVLRGQGDSPVRICEPCKKLEEAARFEMRQGYKNRVAKGSSKLVSKKEDDSEGKGLSSASCSNIQQTVGQVEGGDITRNLSLDQPTNFLVDLESTTPEELREQALVEKKKYRTLKAEGKSEEALRAFKKGKELERQAGALDITLRKNRKKALSSSNRDDVQHIKDHFGVSAEKVKLSTEKSKEKDDLSAELKELGWSDADLRDAEKRPATLTVEGELSSLLREVSHKPGKEKQAVSPDKSQVIARKKKALELKRAGNLLEAKEELKRAKILERKIEEEELLGGTDDSDDELSLLMRSMESDEHDDLSSRYKSDLSFDVNHLVGIANDLGADGNFEVTDEDMEDPEIASALKSFGWADDTAYSEDFPGPVSSSSRESLLTEVQSLKREAVNQKRAGNASEAMALLKKAKVLEMELQPSDNQGSEFIVQDSTTAQKTSVSHSLAGPFSSTWENSENIKNRNSGGPKLARKSKLTIQKELIALKKKALTLRREGRLDESEEELKKAKVLEEQLEEINEAPTVAQQGSHSMRTFMSTDTAIEDGDEEEVTDQDLNDPTYLSLLKNLGWEEEDNVKVPSSTLKENDEVLSIKSKENVVAPNFASNSSVTQSIVNVEAVTSRKSKSEIQRELLALKRKAFALRRQGETEAADEVLKNARSLEIQLQEYEEPTQRHISSENGRGNASFDALQNTKYSLQVDAQENKLGDSRNQVRLEKPEEILKENDKLYIHNLSSSQVTDSQPHSSHLQQEILVDKKLYDHELDSSKAADSQSHSSSLQQEILGHKRKALSLKREGKMAEAKEELRLAKLLEKRVEDTSQTSTNAFHAPVSEVHSIEQKEASPSSGPKMLSSRERFKLQQESLGHKRQALKLRREGKIAEADAEFELAKALETQLQEPDCDSTGSSKSAEPDDASIEDFLDPQLLSALQSIGLEDPRVTTKGTERLESTNSNESNPEDANIERKQFVERIKAEKLKAVNLKRAGNQAEALDALRRAKLYEKKLQSLNSN